MRTGYALTASFLAVCLIAGPVRMVGAVMINVPISLNGDNVRPDPVTTTGLGSGTISYDTDTMMLSANVTFSELVGNVSAAHFHGPATTDESAGVVLGLSASGDTSGTVTGSGILDLTKQGYLFDNLLYVNIHSSFKPGGEIRGQVQGVPEPAMAALAILGGSLALLAPRRRRRRA